MLFAVYPDGRFVPRWIIVPAAIEMALQVANVASGLALERQFWWPMHFAATWALLIIGGQIHRYRSRSSVDERERTRWPLLAIVLMIFGFSLWSFVALGLDAVSTNRSTFWLANLLLILPGVGFAVGLLAPRLLRVDLALRWTIHWGLWSTAMSALAWAVSVALVDLAAAPRAWLTAAIVGATAVPALWAARRIADLTVYGRRSDPLRTLEDLGDRLAASVDPRTVPVDIVTTVTSSLGLAGAAMRGSPALSATAGAPVDLVEGRTEYPIRYQGEQLAVLVVIPRPGDSALTSHDRTVLAQICGQAAPASGLPADLGEHRAIVRGEGRVPRAGNDDQNRELLTLVANGILRSPLHPSSGALRSRTARDWRACGAGESEGAGDGGDDVDRYGARVDGCREPIAEVFERAQRIGAAA